MAKTKRLKSYHFSLGNSSVGPIGYCARLSAHSKKEAVELLKRAIPLELEVPKVSDSDNDNARIEYIEAYLNEDAIKESDIDEIDAHCEVDECTDDADFCSCGNAHCTTHPCTAGGHPEEDDEEVDPDEDEDEEKE